MTTALELDIAYHHGKCEGAISMLPLGAWSSEPHRVEFKHSGFDCLLKRSSFSLVWCGYVAVPETHPYYQKPYTDIPSEIDVHGGLSYSESCNTVICHKGENPEDKVWWLGFDCVHGMDFSPALAFKTRNMAELFKSEPAMQDMLKSMTYCKNYFDLEKNHYWTVDEVKKETIKLAKQLKKVK